jgi:DNA-binding transcriptional LysR family regulator
LPPLRRQIPSLNALATFEAAARLGTFTDAARDLGVTQAAVSRQIRALETDLGAPLFVRHHRRVDLTAAGLALSQALTTGFDRIAEVIDAIRAAHTPTMITLGTTLAFAHFWLLPRLPVFRQAHPDLRLRVVSQDETANLMTDGLDVVVRYGIPPFADGQSQGSLPDVIIPVAAPRLVEPGTGAGLFDLPLIATDWIDPSWMTWSDYARRAGLPSPPATSALRFNHYTDGIYAALAGEGVILGWERLIAPFLADGRLVRLGNCAPVVTDAAYHIVTPHAGQRTAAHAFVAWLRAAFSAD